MKIYPSVVGRGAGNVGYNFSASTDRPPYSAPWIGTLRASDTTADHKPILEMYCVGYGQPVIVSSQWVVDNCLFGFSEYYQLELPESEEERLDYLNHPGQALYLPFMDGQGFLELSGNMGARRGTLPVMELPLPRVQTGDTFPIAPDMLGALLADVWSLSFLKLSEARGITESGAQRNKVLPVRLELTDAANASETLEKGCAFLNQVLLPRLPASVRHTVSVSIGSHWSSLQNVVNLPALAITLPDTSSWTMKGGYHLTTGAYEIAGPPEYLEFGKALCSGQGLEYYWQLHEKWAFTPLAANFLVAYYLYLIQKLLQTTPLTVKNLTDATQLFYALEKKIKQYHENITPSQRRACLLHVEREIIEKRTVLCDAVNDDGKTYDLFARKAFLVDGELGDNQDEALLQSLKNAYVGLLCVPKRLKDWDALPVSRLWTEADLRDDCLKKDPALYVQCVQAALELHLPALAASEDAFDRLLTVYAVLEQPHKRALGDALADALRRLLEQEKWPPQLQRVRLGVARQASAAQRIDEAVLRRAEDFFPDPLRRLEARHRIREYGKKLEAAQQQAFFDALCAGYCAFFLKNQLDDGKPADPFLDTCAFFGWLNAYPVQQAFFAALRRRGDTPSPTLSASEKNVLLGYGNVADDALAEAMEQALTPVATQTADPQGVTFLCELLPLIRRKPVSQPLPGGFGTAYRLLVLQTLAAVLEDARQQPGIVVSPQAAWEKRCPFRWLAVSTLDALTHWQMAPEELLACAQPILSDLLNRCTLADLVGGIQPSGVTDGWFGTLLRGKLSQLLNSRALVTFVAECRSYALLQGLERLCDAFLQPGAQTAVHAAIRFAADRPATESRRLLALFYDLQDRQTAGTLLQMLLTSGDAGPWHADRWEDRMLMAYFHGASLDGDAAERVRAMLADIGIRLSAVETLNPWTSGDGSNALRTVLYAFSWLQQMRLEEDADALRQTLQTVPRFTRAVQTNKQIRRIFASAAHCGPADLQPHLSGPLLAWLFPA